MSLIIWSSADYKTLKNVVAPVITRELVEHQVVSDMTTLPYAEPGDIVLACGSKAHKLLLDLKLFPKNRSLGSVREHPVVHAGVTFLVTYDPTITNMDYARLPEVQWDVQLACRLLKTGTTVPVVGDYQWVESLHEVIERIEEKYAQTGQPVEVASDLETKGLDEYNPEAWIISIFFTVDPGKSYGLYFEKGEAPIQPLPFKSPEELEYWEALWMQIHWILTSRKVSIRGANWKYDSRWLVQKWKIDCTNHRFDTLLAGSLLDENRSNSLKLHAKIYTSLGGYEDGMDKYDFGALELVPKEDLVIYAGGDTDATLQVATCLKTELLKDKRLSNFYVNLLHPSSHVFERMERNGVLVDVPYYHSLQMELSQELKRLEGEMLEMIPHKLRIKYKDKIASQQENDKSPLTPALLKEFLFTQNGLGLKPLMFTEKTGEPSTSGDHLMMFEDNEVASKFIGLYKEHNSASKTQSTYVIGFLKHLRSDGRWHPHYMLFRGDYGDDDSGTNTGRTSAKDPAVQTIPKHTKWTKKLRRGLIAPPGKTILQLDFSQGELRIAAVVAQEPVMIDAYLKGMDLHAITAASLNGYELDDFMLLPEDVRDELRSGGKAGNFGLLYGMGANGFRQYAYVSYGVKMTDAEAHQKREAFFNTYQRLPEWHEESRKYARMHGFVRSPLGRVRHLPLINAKDSGVRSQAERQSINSQIQSTLSDLMQLAMVAIDREYGQDVIEMFLMTHDSLGLYVPLGDEVLWAKRLKSIMENLPLKQLFGWESPLKFIADAEAAVPGEDGVISFAGLKKLKGL